MTKLAADWFDTPEKWRSFLELNQAKTAIQDRWFDHGSTLLRNAYLQNSSPQWTFKAWDGYIRDTWWYLNEFGANSIGVGFGWRFNWCFGGLGSRVDHARLRELLSLPRYQPLHAAFGPVHNRDWGTIAWLQKPDFKFGPTSDCSMSEAELAWFAGHRGEEFSVQALARLKTFTHSAEITALVIELNRELLR